MEIAMRLIASLAAILALLGVPALAANVGFEEIKIADEADKPLTAGIWYPTASPAIAIPLQGYTQTVATGGAVSGYRLPLVVFSHGGGGSYAGHYDTALALARAGFIVAAV